MKIVFILSNEYSHTLSFVAILEADLQKSSQECCDTWHGTRIKTKWLKNKF